ncbi:MAG TPA: N-methyl-L-tryptophan oxidase [Candidatus Limnocylindrales bacterium]|nr:N-methyl-L-tryptophan oxidase [Candidatus Limnocylindrales bacterium]
MDTFDAIVVGLGAHGSAATAALARRGLRVAGLERFGRGEAFGSSGGWSRMIRLTHFEDPNLVPLALESWDRWLALGDETGTTLLEETGGLYAGPPGHPVVDGSRLGAQRHGLAFEALDSAEIHRRWPIFRPADDTVAVLETRAGLLHADRANAASLDVAERAGAQLMFGRRVVAWRSAPGGGVEVEDADGSVIGGDHLVVAAGPWLGSLLPDLRLPLRVERECPCWFWPTVDPASVGADRLPIWVMVEQGTAFYGVRHDPEVGLKVSIHHWGTFVDPESVDRVVAPADIDRIRAFMRIRMPEADGALAHARVCLYTNTPDEQFVIDRHPAAEGVAFASACSGHGFKFAPVVAEILADLATTGSTAYEVERFRADRFSASRHGVEGRTG